jgi:hypothetical protein
MRYSLWPEHAMTRVRRVSEVFILRFSTSTCFYIDACSSILHSILSRAVAFWDQECPYLLIAGFGDACFGLRSIVSDASPYTYHLAVQMNILSSSIGK